MVPISYQHLSELQNILGPKGLTTDKEERLLYSYDAAGRSFMPDAIVFPESETQVVTLIEQA